MVGANGGGSFLVPWLIFLFLWSVPLIIAEFALGKRSRVGTVGTFRIFAGRRFAWMGLWTAWINCAIGFYYAVVTGWCLNYFQIAIRGGLSQEVDTIEVWNTFLQSPEQVIFFQMITVMITLAAIWGGAKAIEKANVTLMISLFVLLFTALFLSFVMDVKDGTLDGFIYMFSIQPEYLVQPETWINGLSQSAWSCSAGMGMAITYSVYMRKDEDTTLNAATMCLANNSISIIAGLTVMMAVFSVSSDPLGAVSGGSSAITFLVLPEVFAQAPGGPVVQLAMVAIFFLALSFAALTSMISTVELCVRNFVDHGFDRSRSVALTGLAIFLFGIPSAVLWIKMDPTTGVRFPQFLEVQDHIWGYGLMFSGLFIAFTIWKYGFLKWRDAVQAGNAEPGLKGYLTMGVPAFRDDFINTGDNDLWIGRWWDALIYIAFPILFFVLMASYFGDMIANTENVWDPSNPKGLGIILSFWSVVAITFMLLNKKLVSRPLFRNVPEGAEVDVSMLPAGKDELVVEVGDYPPGWEHLNTDKAAELVAEIIEDDTNNTMNAPT